MLRSDPGKTCAMAEHGTHADKPVDRLRPGLLQVILHRLHAFNANTRLLLRLLEEPDWRDLGTRALEHVRTRVLH